METLKILITSSAFIAALGALATFLIKTIFKSFIDKDVEEFKATLQMLVNQNQLQFSTLHLERAKVIKDLYYGLVDTEKLMKSFLIDHSADVSSEKRQAAMAQLAIFQDFMERNKVYFDDHTCNLLDEFVRTLRSMDMEKFLAKEFKESANLTGNIDDAKEANKLRKEIWDNLHENKIPRLKQELRKEFQQILGVRATEM